MAAGKECGVFRFAITSIGVLAVITASAGIGAYA
jgi:hypothetical protein